MKQVLAIATGLEVVKVLFLSAIILLALNLSIFENETLSAILLLPIWLLMLPEMMSSCEHGPHSIGAYVVMFAAGILGNILPALLLIWFKASGKATRLSKRFYAAMKKAEKVRSHCNESRAG